MTYTSVKPLSSPQYRQQGSKPLVSTFRYANIKPASKGWLFFATLQWRS